MEKVWLAYSMELLHGGELVVVEGEGVEECELLDSFQISEQVVGKAEGGDPLEVGTGSNLLDMRVVQDYLLVVGEMLFFLKQFRK